MSDFSLPTSLNQKLTPLIPQSEQKQLIQMIAWMLQHRLLFQLHTYVHLMPTMEGHPARDHKKLLCSTSTSNEHLSRTPSDFDVNGESSLTLYEIKNEVPTLKTVIQFLLNNLNKILNIMN